ncbi:efflux RND transporter periplasmic adaptor subunit [Cystobacter ferrugineus]|uniref:RND transporter n=1 Tax=Cystobacter ferrugineus TaxID=83449 RepID=A0A1L9B8G6_9BACT|nr:HlyD family efflux transporter periplasmic adaptor subunit [Cystobacter ferrugineus]OJH38550.1 RND transporter [Cystobacter ferrugineus]
MDIPRPTKNRRRASLLYGALLLGALVLITFGMSQLGQAAPEVDGASVWIDSVKQGEMVRQVVGPGTLVPENFRWITADTAGRIEHLPLRPGASVKEDTQLMELSNPDVALQALEAERQLAVAEGEWMALKEELEMQRLEEESSLARLSTEQVTTRRRAESTTALGEKQYIASVEMLELNEKSQELGQQLQLQQRRLEVISRSMANRLAAQRAQVQRLKAVVDFRRGQVESMKVRARTDGLLQELSVELGQWVTPGMVLAKVIQPGVLKAVLRVPETLAKDVQPGQLVKVDTRTAIVPGKVARVAPAAVQGTVLVEVSLEGELPAGARPDLSVEGTIELERLDGVLNVGRPAGAQPSSTMELFRLTADGTYAERVKVHLGRSSVNTIEVLDGLAAGDRVILSDMSAWSEAPRVRVQ